MMPCLLCVILVHTANRISKSAHGNWVGPLVTSSEELAESTQETFDWALSAMKAYLGYLCFIIYNKCLTL